MDDAIYRMQFPPIEDPIGIEEIIFDVDGTLVDSLGQSYKVDKNLIERYGGNIPSLDSYRTAIGMGDWDKFYETFGIKDPELKKSLLDEYYQETSKVPLQPTPYAKELLEYLREISIPLSVVSINKNKEKVVNRLRKTGLEKFFDESSIQVSNTTKTECIRKRCERRIHSYALIFIGDTAKDVVEARKAGTRTVAISWEGSYHTREMIEESKPDYLLRSLKEFYNLIKGE